jgi:putative peptidoglycan lipid II flippase
MSRKLFKSTLVTGGMTLLSRISGLVRDIIFAGIIGAGAGVAADAFYVAFRIPNFLRRIFGEGAFSQAFVPVFSEHKTRDTHAQLRDFVDRLTGILALILFLVTLVGVIAAPVMVSLLAPGFTGEKYQLTVQMLRLTFPYLLFISLVAMAAGILNSYGRFAAAAFTPVLLNLCLIGSALWLAPYMHNPAMALAWGVFVAGAAQLLFQIPFLAKLGLLPRPRLARGHDGVSKVFRLMLPAIFGVSVAQINTLVNTILASFLVTGSVSWLYYSDRLMEFPLGVFGIALATVILPSLSQKHATASTEEFSHLLDWALRLSFLVGTPATVALMVLAGPMLATMFHHGAFSATDVSMSAQALVAFALGLLGFILIKVLAPGFYARQDTRTPVRIGMISMAANIVMSLLLVSYLKHVGLALAISLAAFINAGLLYRKLRLHNIYRPEPGWAGYLLRVTAASLVMGGVLWWGVGELTEWFAMATRERILRLSFYILIGMAVYIASLLALGVRPRQLLLKKVTRGTSAHDE